MQELTYIGKTDIKEILLILPDNRKIFKLFY